MESEPDSEELTDWERIRSPTDSSVQAVNKNHEDLRVKAPEDNNQGVPEVTNLEPSSSREDGQWRVKKLHQAGSVLCGWIAGGIRKKAVFRVGFWSFALATSGVAAALALFSLLVWRKNRGEEGLLVIIKDKEKRINQLLLQIAQMNEVLRARQRVRVLRANHL